MYQVFGALRLGLGIAASCFTLAVQATPITLTGDTISYVYDNSQAAASLYGTPTITGDVVRFVPFSYGAQSLNGSGEVSLLSEFLFSSIYSHTGAEITGIEVLAFGDYRIIRGDGVSADFQLSAGNNSAAEAASAGNAFGASDVSGLQTWSLSAALNPADLFAGSANDISLSLKPLLTAMTDTNAEAAWINVKLLFLKVTAEGAIVDQSDEAPAVVPTPGVAVLFLTALLAAGLVNRKRSQEDSGVAQVKLWAITKNHWQFAPNCCIYGRTIH